MRRLSFELGHGETLGLVGESGSGKSATAMSILRLLPPNGTIVAGSVELQGESLVELSWEAMRRIRGDRIALIPQNPLTALNPVFTIGWQLCEALSVHHRVSNADVRERLVEALSMTGLPDPKQQLDRYPHEFSGGMRQRVLIAMAILNQPALLLADEPTTALDTTTQAQIIHLLDELVQRYGMGLLLITHNMGVVARLTARVAVMYAGELVEEGPTRDVFAHPLHPYTKLLLDSSPMLRARSGRRLGKPSSPARRRHVDPAAGGCRFLSRCPLARESCVNHPELVSVAGASDRAVRCWVAHETGQL